jgi:hypothetical protein
METRETLEMSVPRDPRVFQETTVSLVPPEPPAQLVLLETRVLLEIRELPVSRAPSAPRDSAVSQELPEATEPMELLVTSVTWALLVQRVWAHR